MKFLVKLLDYKIEVSTGIFLVIFFSLIYRILFFNKWLESIGYGIFTGITIYIVSKFTKRFNKISQHLIAICYAIFIAWLINLRLGLI